MARNIVRKTSSRRRNAVGLTDEEQSMMDNMFSPEELVAEAALPQRVKDEIKAEVETAFEQAREAILKMDADDRRNRSRVGRTRRPRKRVSKRR
jgi:hypothetical protein